MKTIIQNGNNKYNPGIGKPLIAGLKTEDESVLVI